MPHQVFIEKAVDASASGQLELAQQVAQRFGILVDSIFERIKAGRFRVKANVDLKTAQQFVTMLESLGALCSIVNGKGEIVYTTDPNPQIALDQATPPKTPGQSKTTLPGIIAKPSQAAKTSASPEASRGALPVKPVQTFGALDNLSESALVGLNSDDDGGLGGDAPSTDLPTPSPEDFAALSSTQQKKAPLVSPAAAPLSSSQLEESIEHDFDNLTNPGLDQLSGVDGSDYLDEDDKATHASPTSSDDYDAFLPPEASQKSEALVLDETATQPVDRKPLGLPLQAKKDAFANDSDGGATPYGSSGTGSGGAGADQAEASQNDIDSKSKTTRRKWTWHKRFISDIAFDSIKRLWVGLAFVLTLSFVPAHCVAHFREQPAYEKIRQEVSVAQAEVKSADDWDLLETLRHSKVKEMKHKRRNIAISTFVLWMGLAGVLGFLFFLKVPWNRLAGLSDSTKA